MEEVLVSRARLRGEIAKNDMTQADVCNALHISRPTLNKKLNAKQSFSEEEILKLVKLFGSGILFLPS
jgi:plasmid maintenance system antidote protein VapI